MPIIRIQDLTEVVALGFYNGDYPKRIEINEVEVRYQVCRLGVYVWMGGEHSLNQII